MSTKIDMESEQKNLVLARFRTLNPQSKLSLGGNNEMTVKELIECVEKGNDFGKKVIMVQMKMLRVLGGAL